MSILTKEDRKDLVWSMRMSLLESVKTSDVLTEGKKAAARDFIINEATYEQLLNLAFNPERETNYKKVEVLEKVALETYASIQEALPASGMLQNAARKTGAFIRAKPKTAAAIAGGSLLAAGAVGRATAPRRENVEESAKEKAKQIMGTVKDTAIKGVKKSGNIIAKHPHTAVLGGIAVGASAAHALKKRRDKKMNEAVVTEAHEDNEAYKSGANQDRFARFGRRFITELKGLGRQIIMTFKVWLWPTYLWSDAVNICKILARTGTRENATLRIDLMSLMRSAGDGKFKTGEQFNHAIQAVMAKHNLRKQRLFDHAEAE